MQARQTQLASDSPAYNTTWGINHVSLNTNEVVAVGASRTFVFMVTAPSTPGTYTLQWFIDDQGVGAIVHGSPQTITVS